MGEVIRFENKKELDKFLLENHLREKEAFEQREDFAIRENNNIVQFAANNLILINTVILTAIVILFGSYHKTYPVITGFMIATLAFAAFAIISGIWQSIKDQNFLGTMQKNNHEVAAKLQITMLNNNELEINTPQEIDNIIISIHTKTSSSKPNMFFFWCLYISSSFAVVCLLVVLILFLTMVK